MSGLEVVGAASAIVGLIQAAFQVADYIKSVKDAPTEAHEFSGHVETLKSILINVEKKAMQVSREHGSEDKWNQELERLNPVFVSLKLAFQAFDKQVKGQLGWRERLRWSHHKESAQAILVQISSLQICLQTALTGDVLAFTSAISLTLEELSCQIRHLNYRMQRLTLNLEDIQEAGNSVRSWTVSQDQKNLIEHLAPEKYALWSKDGFIYGSWHESSGRWLINSHQYQKWHKTKGSGLWCYGTAGAGKTVLAAIIIEDLVSRNPEIPVLKLYFDRYNKSRPQTREACLASLWHELASRRSFGPEEINNLENTHIKQHLPVSYNKWKEMLSNEVRRYQPVFIVVDALDEFNHLWQLQLIDDLLNMSQSANILVTSRDVLAAEDAELLHHPGILRIVADKSDLSNYVDKRLTISELPRRLRNVLTQHPALRDSIRERVVESSGQM